MNPVIRILLIEDYKFDAELVELELRDAGLEFEISKIDEKNEFKKLLDDFSPDIILADYKLPGWNALDALKFLKEKNYDIPLILVTGTQTEQVAIESMKLGAVDYIIKDNLKRLPNAVINAIKNKEFERGKFDAEEALKAEFTFRKTIEDSMLAGVTTYDTGFTQTYVNTAFCKMVGWPKENLIGKKPPFIYWTAENKEKILENIYSHLQKNIPTIQYETKFQRKNGELFDVQVLSSAMKDSSGRITGWVEVVHDIAEQKQKERQIKASLEEKEILLKEIHHRVKNNMQIVSSLLSLQAGYSDDEKIQEVFNESRNRIKVLALIHENLYKSKELTNINFTNYVKDLVHNLFLTYNLNSDKFKFIQEFDDICFDMDVSINLGIIINELVSNSIKHAFQHSGNSENIIRVKLKGNERKINLTISDNGKGIKKCKDFINSESLGSQLVKTLVDQLEGTMDVKNNGGAEISIQFNYVQDYKPIMNEYTI